MEPKDWPITLTKTRMSIITFLEDNGIPRKKLLSMSNDSLLTASGAMERLLKVAEEEDD